MLTAIALCALLAATAPATGGYRDPEDNYFDISDSVLSESGFVPTPLIVTEPSIGVGLGLAPVWFHGKNKLTDENGELLPADERLPPSATAAFGLVTSNGSWVLGAGHFGSWRRDRVRYLGAAAATELNLSFYVDDDPFDFEITGGVLYQDLRFRLGSSRWFLGGSYIYLNAEAVFEIDSEVPGVDPAALDSTNAGLAAIAYYDSRDNLFTPLEGFEMLLKSTFHRQSLGGDFDYDQLDLDLKAFHPLSRDRVFFGARLFAQATDGDAPFYGLPFVRLRGVPALRYQGDSAASLELQTRWVVHPRWSVLAFGGAGATKGTDTQANFSDIYAGGAGFRYLLARAVGFWGGIDVARGPEEWAYYIVLGSAWR